MIANLQNTIFNTRGRLGMAVADARRPTGAPAARTRRLLTSPLFHVSGCHSTLVVGHPRRAQAGDPRGPVRAREGARSSSQDDRRHHLGHGADDGVAGVRAPRPPRLRHVVGDQRWRSAARRRPTSCSAWCTRRSRTCSSTTNAYGLTESSSVATVDQRPGRARQARRRWARRCRSSSCASSDADGDGGRRRASTGEVLINGPIIMAGLLEQARGHRRDHRRRLAAHRRHRPPRRGRATSTSPTGPRT